MNEGNTLHITAALGLAVDDAKRAGTIEPIRKTAEYRMMLEQMDKDGKNPHEVNVKNLDMVCEQVVAKTNLMTPEMRKIAEESLLGHSQPFWDTQAVEPQKGAGKTRLGAGSKK
jgi:hypothetical protein